MITTAIDKTESESSICGIHEIILESWILVRQLPEFTIHINAFTIILCESMYSDIVGPLMYSVR